MKYEIGKPWVDRWWSKRSDDEQALRSFMREQHRIEVHYQGAAVNTEQQEIPYWDYLLRTDWKRSGGTNGRSFFFGPVGTEMPRTPVTIDILTLGDEPTERCARYLSLLEQMVEAFLAAYP